MRIGGREMSDEPKRLTAAECRPGMRVVCVDDQNGRWGLRAGNEYVLSKGGSESNCVEVEGNNFVHLVSRFIAAPALPAMTPELAEAHTGWYWSMAKWLSAGIRPTPEETALMDAIERAGILAPPAPRTTDMQPTLQEGWWS